MWRCSNSVRASPSLLLFDLLSVTYCLMVKGDTHGMMNARRTQLCANMRREKRGDGYVVSRGIAPMRINLNEMGKVLSLTRIV